MECARILGSRTFLSWRLPCPLRRQRPKDCVKPTFRYDSKTRGEERREEVNMVSSSVITEFAYMVAADAFEDDEAASVRNATEDLEVVLSSVPRGCAVIDTGCTSSVIGDET